MNLLKSAWAAFVVPAVLVALLGVLAVMQYRWIGENSEAERARMQAAARARAAQMAEEFDAEISRAYLTFYQLPTQMQMDPVAFASQQYARWLATSRHPRLIRGVFILKVGGDKEPELLRVSPGQGAEPAAWPPEFAQWIPRLKSSASLQASVHGFVLADVPAFFTPLMNLNLSQSKASVKFSGSSTGILFGWLDRAYLEKEYLPAVVAKYFSARDGFDYNVVVVAPREKNRVVYASGRGLGGDGVTKADVKTSLLQVRFEQIMQAIAGPVGASLGFRSDPNAGEWQLLLVHRAGSLDKAIAIARRRNIAISFGVVLLVVASIGSIVVSTRRAQRLARQQIEFVAGVSHELRTPLSVIRSAGENLSDGVIAEPAQVKRYGTLIAEEGRRLSEMVEQVMAFAGFNSGCDLSERSHTEVGVLVEAAVAASGPLIGRTGFALEKRVPPGLPTVTVNTAALTQAIENLINNAVKYSGPNRWVRVSAEAAPASRGTEVRITVEDRGVGIRPDEQGRIFEPFFRGRDVLASTIRGSGLGLSLVKRTIEAHGGSISVRSAPGQGSAFTLHLPCDAAGETT